jgi:23S rRNA pseudouridine1911/1915/1917 synthase
MPTSPHTSTDNTIRTDKSSGEPVIIEATGDIVGQRLDRVLASRLAMSRTRAQALIDTGRVTVDERPAKASLVLESGMRIVVASAQPDLAKTPSPRAQPDVTPPPPLNIVYEDAHILVVDKPAGVVVHPSPGHAAGTLVDALRAHVPDLDTGDDPTRPGIVHRLDKDTSGLLVVAKDPASHTALVEGNFSTPEGVVEAPIGRDPRNRQRMAIVRVAAGGREARTRFRVLQMARGRTLLELQLETGRTPPIRVHLAAVHHPVVGDPVYGRPQPPLPPRQFLHAAHLEFAHPITGEWLTFDAPLPPDLATFLAQWSDEAP